MYLIRPFMLPSVELRALDHLSMLPPHFPYRAEWMPFKILAPVLTCCLPYTLAFSAHPVLLGSGSARRL